MDAEDADEMIGSPMLQQLADETVDQPEVSPEEYREGFGEDLQHTLDVSTWQTGEDLASVYRRIEAEIREAVKDEQEHRATIRRVVFPRLGAAPGAPKGAGVYTVDANLLERIHRGILFNGGMEACDGTLLAHDTLPLTIFQIGVSLVSYRGEPGHLGPPPVPARPPHQRPAIPRSECSSCWSGAQRGAASTSPTGATSLAPNWPGGASCPTPSAPSCCSARLRAWRMGHGNPAPLRTDHRLRQPRPDDRVDPHPARADRGASAFIFVASEPRDRVLLTIGEALRPLEYAVVGTLTRQHLWHGRTRALSQPVRHRGYHAGTACG